MAKTEQEAAANGGFCGFFPPSADCYRTRSGVQSETSEVIYKPKSSFHGIGSHCRRKKFGKRPIRQGKKAEEKNISVRPSSWWYTDRCSWLLRGVQCEAYEAIFRPG